MNRPFVEYGHATMLVKEKREASGRRESAKRDWSGTPLHLLVDCAPHWPGAPRSPEKGNKITPVVQINL